MLCQEHKESGNGHQRKKRERETIGVRTVVYPTSEGVEESQGEDAKRTRSAVVHPSHTFARAALEERGRPGEEAGVGRLFGETAAGMKQTVEHIG